MTFDNNKFEQSPEHNTSAHSASAELNLVNLLSDDKAISMPQVSELKNAPLSSKDLAGDPTFLCTMFSIVPTCPKQCGKHA
jgi:hypothetical protein